MMARTSARIVVALALAGLLGQPTGALGFGGGGGGALGNVVYTYANHPINPNLTRGDMNLTIQSPYPNPLRVATGAPNVPAYQNTTSTYTPQQGDNCSSHYSAGITLAAADPMGNRLATWQTAQDYIRTAAPWMTLSPAAVKDAPAWDGGFLVLTGQSTQPPGTQQLYYLEQNLGQSGQLIQYTLTASFQPKSPSDPTLTCMVTKYSEQQTSGPWCRSTNTSAGCSFPIPAATVSPDPPCAGPACVPAVQNVINPSILTTLAHQVWSNGGAVVQGQGGPALSMEAVQIPATFTLTGLGQPDVYASMQVAVPNAGTNVGVVSYQVHISYTGSEWWLDDHSSPAEHPQQHPPELICSSATTCGPYLFTTIGHYGIRAISHFAVEYRFIYTSSYPDVVQQSPDWPGYTAFPGTDANFDLCASYSDPAPAPAGGACGPGERLIVGQFEAVVVNPGPH